MASAGAAEPRKDYPALDAMRGVAAMAVVLFHFAPPAPFTFSSGYVAVDLFFLLSGFVIANAYGQRRIEGSLSYRDFALIRFIRLWPLYALATLAAASFRLTAGVMHSGAFSERTIHYSVELILGLLCIPSLLPGEFELYPLVQVAWSLFYEVLVNLVYAWRPAWWTRGRLIAAIVIGIVAAGWFAYAQGTWAAGWLFSHIPFAITRTAASFAGGVLLYHYRDAVIARMPRVPLWVLIIVLIAALDAPFDRSAYWYGLAFSLILSPALVMLALAAPPSRHAGFQRQLGLASYPIYVLQMPAFTGSAAISYFTGLSTMIANCAAALALFATAPLIVAWIDTPVRRRLSAWLLPRPRREATALNEEAAP